MSDDAPTRKQTAPGDLELLRAFVNTLDIDAGSDEIADPASTAAWLKERGLLGPDESAPSPEEQERIVAVRRALRALLRANGGEAADPAALEVLDAASQRAVLTVRFTGDDPAHLATEASGVDGALARLFAIVHDAQIDGSWPLLKICGNDECQWAFFDHSRNHSGVWCSMAVCGNRMKARAYRERRKS